MISKQYKFTLLALLLAVLCCANAFGAAINIVPSGNNGYVVVGSALSVAGIEMVISYDSTGLSNPKIVQGSLVSGALFSVNPNFTPQSIKIAIVQATNFSGSGPIATINFDRKTAEAGITNFTVKAVNEKGANVNVAATYSNNAGSSAPVADTGGSPVQPLTTQPPASTTPAGSGGTTTTATATGTAGAAPGMTISMPSDGSMGKDAEKKQETARVEQTPMLQPADTGIGSSRAAEIPRDTEEKVAQLAPQKKYLSYPSVLDNFKSFNGVQTPESLTALFKPQKDLPYQQSPMVALADGKQNLTLTIRIGDLGSSAPNFALENAKMVTLKKGAQGEWIIEVQPKKDELDASLTLYNNETTTTIPLAIAPALQPEQLAGLKGFTEKDFKLFIKERGNKDAPRFDLNKDGKRDYIDDYIFTANYLAAAKEGAKGKEPKK